MKWHPLALALLLLLSGCHQGELLRGYYNLELTDDSNEVVYTSEIELVQFTDEEKQTIRDALRDIVVESGDEAIQQELALRFLDRFEGIGRDGDNPVSLILLKDRDPFSSKLRLYAPLDAFSSRPSATKYLISVKPSRDGFDVVGPSLYERFLLLFVPELAEIYFRAEVGISRESFIHEADSSPTIVRGQGGFDRELDPGRVEELLDFIP